MPMILTYTHPTEGEVTINQITKLEGNWNKYGKLTHYTIFTGGRPTDHRFLGRVNVSWVTNLDYTFPDSPQPRGH